MDGLVKNKVLISERPREIQSHVPEQPYSERNRPALKYPNSGLFSPAEGNVKGLYY